ncbi:MAG: hypothetical protein ACI8RD_003754 [Bacillariaceae sp.]|jgi:hypothetical protein
MYYRREIKETRKLHVSEYCNLDGIAKPEQLFSFYKEKRKDKVERCLQLENTFVHIRRRSL